MMKERLTNLAHKVYDGTDDLTRKTAEDLKAKRTQSTNAKAQQSAKKTIDYLSKHYGKTNKRRYF